MAAEELRAEPWAAGIGPITAGGSVGAVGWAGTGLGSGGIGVVQAVINTISAAIFAESAVVLVRFGM